jgi:hypothetical protein
MSYEPDAAFVDELELGQVDALIGLGEYRHARERLVELGGDAQLDEAVEGRYMRIRELEHAVGAGSCDVDIDTQPRPLAQHDDFLSAWNDLSAALPDGATPAAIPVDADDARLTLCRSCGDAPVLASVEHDDGASFGLVMARAEGAISVMPGLLDERWGSCGDDSRLHVERRGDLLWVRAFSDTREDFDVSDWNLGDTANLGPQNPSPGYFGSTRSDYASSASPGYASSGYASSGYASSGYQGYQYGYGYAYYGCGGHGYDYGYGYDYAYEDCVITRSIERDVFIDLSRGVVVLDVVRDGPPTSPLGVVELDDGGGVHVDACGVQRSFSVPDVRS